MIALSLLSSAALSLIWSPDMGMCGFEKRLQKLIKSSITLIDFLTRFNKIAIQGTPQMAVD